MKEGLGIKDTHSLWDTLNNPQVTVVVLGLMGQLASMMRPDPKPSKIIYVAEVDGKDTEMTEEEFREFKLKRAMPKITSENGTLAAATLSGAAQKATSGDGYQPGDDIQCVFVPPP